MLELEGRNTLTSSRQPLLIVLKKIMQKHGLLAAINGDNLVEEGRGQRAEGRRIS